MTSCQIRCCVNTLVLGLTLITTPASAALVQTGNVEPDVNKWFTTHPGYIGRTSDGSVLVNNASVLSSRAGYLGYYAGSTGEATVTGAHSQWEALGWPLYVGYEGAGVLTVDAGGRVRNSTGYLGYNAGSNGSATVSGAGSTWAHSNALYVGYHGNGVLTVTDGGQVVADDLYASLSDLSGNGTITASTGGVLDADLLFNATHGNQKIFAFGTGGILTVNWSGGSLGVGYRQTGTMAVTEGVAVSSEYGWLGYHSGSIGTATVSGPGSHWNTGSLYLGRAGSGILNVEAGGKVTSQSAILGDRVDSMGSATVTGPGSRWENNNSLYVGREGNGELTVADGGEVHTGDLYASLSNLSGNGTITATKGAVLDAEMLFDSSNGNQTTLTFGSGGTLTVTAVGGVLGAGYKESGSLTVAEGVNVYSPQGYLGFYAGSTGTATVTGADSRWNSPGLVIGRSGTGALSIEEGGKVTSTSGVVGIEAGSTGLATIAGEGSEWTTGQIYIGDRGSGTLVIEDRGKVTSGSFSYLGSDEGSTGSVTVRGAGSQWNGSRDLFVGGAGTGTLNIEDGGSVSSGGGVVSSSSASTGSATVMGAGTRWTVSAGLRIGEQGNGTLTVADGGEVVAGYLNASITNLLGNGSITVSRGGTLDAEILFDAAHGNQAIIPFGVGGTLTFQVGEGSGLGVGLKGNGKLTITDGVTISSTSGVVGFGSGSSGIAIVSGAGSQWSIEKYCSTCNIGSSLDVGHFGDGSLIIEAGGQVTNAVGTVGRVTGTTGSVRVSGAGSSWSCSENLYIGENGNGTLIIEAGGIVTGYSSRLAFRESSTSSAIVTGSSSRWENQSLGVGGQGIGILNVTGGGLVSVEKTLVIDSDLDNDSFINMATGGMLALKGDADDSLDEFYNLVVGTDAIRYWDASLLDWAPLASATYGSDYTLEYLTDGDLAGYTLLTVGRVGDFDNDGDVDGRDLLAWQRNPELGSLADWQSQYANGSPPATTAVPEPTGWALAISLAISCLVWPRNRT